MRLKNLIGGEWVPSSSESMVPVYNPSIGEVIAETPLSTPEDVDRAVDSASRAYESWSRVPAPTACHDHVSIQSDTIATLRVSSQVGDSRKR